MAIKKKSSLEKAPRKNGFERLKSYFAKQEEKVRSSKRRQFAFFVLGFLAAYLVLTFAISIVPEISVKQATGNAAQGMLSIEGIATSPIGSTQCEEISWIGDTVPGECYSFFVPNGPQMISSGPDFPASGKTIVISWLCTGALEIIILVSAILASFGVGWRKKAVGVIGAVVLGVVFNLLRIVVTVNIILSQNVQTVELAHDLIFRLVLFVYIVALYVGWFYWAMNTKKIK